MCKSTMVKKFSQLNAMSRTIVATCGCSARPNGRTEKWFVYPQSCVLYGIFHLSSRIANSNTNNQKKRWHKTHRIKTFVYSWADEKQNTCRFQYIILKILGFQRQISSTLTKAQVEKSIRELVVTRLQGRLFTQQEQKVLDWITVIKINRKYEDLYREQKLNSTKVSKKRLLIISHY